MYAGCLLCLARLHASKDLLPVLALPARRRLSLWP